MKKTKLMLSTLLLAATLTYPAYATETLPAGAALEETTAVELDLIENDEPAAAETKANEPGDDSAGADSNTASVEQTGASADDPSAPPEYSDENISLEDTDRASSDAGIGQNVAANTNAATSDSDDVADTTEDDTAEGDDNITLIETGTALDENGNVTLSMYTAENVVLPVTVTMRGADGAVEFTVREQGQQLKMKPDTYTLTKVVDGNGQKLADGAYLDITDEGGAVYLDFTAPEENGFQLSEFLLSNLLFIPFLILLYAGFRWFKKHYI